MFDLKKKALIEGIEFSITSASADHAGGGVGVGVWGMMYTPKQS